MLISRRWGILTLVIYLAMTVVAAGPALADSQKKAPAGQLTTIAQSAVLMDSNGTVIYEKNSHLRLPPASVTKTMTLLLAVEAVEQDRIKLDDAVFTTENAWRQGGSQIWLEPGENMTVKDLLTAVAVVSANDAAVALMEQIYGNEPAAVEAMNQKAAELGLQDTHFANVNGLPATDHYMSAYDTAQRTKEAVKHPLYMDLCGVKEAWLRDGKNWLVNTNKLLWWYKGADGLKTGWTEEAKYCFVGTAQRDKLRLIAVVFATPEPRSHLRESMKLLDWGFANYTAVPITEQGEILAQVKVNKGVDRNVTLVAARDLNLLVGKGQSKNIQKKVITEQTLNAPVGKGQKYGEVIVLKDGAEVERVDLIAEQAVEKAGFIKIMQDMVVNFLALD